MPADFDTRLEREKLDAMKELAYGASHEINNPLANISARAQALLRDETHDERRQALEAIRQQAMRAHEMIADLMLFARPPALALGPVELSGRIRAIAATQAAECARRNISLLIHTPDQPVEITADAQQLEVAIRAICTNALEAIGELGSVEINLKDAHPTANCVTISVADTGSGMSDEVRRHLFDPFFSGREAGRGLGFGLSKAWRIVTDHSGTITVSSASGEGSTISLQLPKQGPQPQDSQR